jgi:hypothetical protein
MDRDVAGVLWIRQLSLGVSGSVLEGKLQTEGQVVRTACFIGFSVLSDAILSAYLPPNFCCNPLKVKSSLFSSTSPLEMPRVRYILAFCDPQWYSY